MTFQVKHRLFQLVQEKENSLGRRLTLTEISEGANVSPSLVGRWLDLERPQTRFDAHAIAGFCAYFECGIEDLLYLESQDTDSA